MSDPEREASERRKIHLASWDDRFWAWVIDIILVGAVLSALTETVSTVFVLTGTISISAPALGASGVGLWMYWTALEGYQGQSAGKLVMDIAVTDRVGEEISYVQAGIESVGKAFLLPLDVLIGWIAMEGEYVRLFNRLSETIVVERPEDDRVPDDVEYVRPDE